MIGNPKAMMASTPSIARIRRPKALRIFQVDCRVRTGIPLIPGRKSQRPGIDAVVLPEASLDPDRPLAVDEEDHR